MNSPAMNSPTAQIKAARQYLQDTGWIPTKSEFFQHLPPPKLDQWLPEQSGPAATEGGWTLEPQDRHAEAVQARHLNALDSQQRKALFDGVPEPARDDDARFAWAHRALCQRGLRIEVQPAADGQPVWLRAHHLSTQSVAAPMLVLRLAPGAHAVLLEDQQYPENDALNQNLLIDIELAAGATLEHLRAVVPAENQQLAHHIQVRAEKNAHYTQAMISVGSKYHLQHNHISLLGDGARARNGALLFAGEHAIDSQTYTVMNAPHTHSDVEMLALASGSSRTVANAYTLMNRGVDDADANQMLKGIALEGQPRMILRPHLEIHHDQVAALHGATWGALPQDAIFYAQQRGLDAVTARALIIEGMAHAVLQRCLVEPGEDAMLEQWLQGDWLGQIIERYLIHSLEMAHG